MGLVELAEANSEEYSFTLYSELEDDIKSETTEDSINVLLRCNSLLECEEYFEYETQKNSDKRVRYSTNNGSLYINKDMMYDTRLDEIPKNVNTAEEGIKKTHSNDFETTNDKETDSDIAVVELKYDNTDNVFISKNEGLPKYTSNNEQDVNNTQYNVVNNENSSSDIFSDLFHSDYNMLEDENIKKSKICSLESTDSNKKEDDDVKSTSHSALSASTAFLQDLLSSIADIDDSYSDNKEFPALERTQLSSLDMPVDIVISNNDLLISSNNIYKDEIIAHPFSNNATTNTNISSNLVNSSTRFTGNENASESQSVKHQGIFCNKTITSGFTTGNMNKIYIPSNKVEESKLHFGIESQNDALFDFAYKPAENMVVSGFVTGNNEKIYINENEIPSTLDKETECSHKNYEAADENYNNVKSNNNYTNKEGKEGLTKRKPLDLKDCNSNVSRVGQSKATNQPSYITRQEYCNQPADSQKEDLRLLQPNEEQENYLIQENCFEKLTYKDTKLQDRPVTTYKTILDATKQSKSHLIRRYANPQLGHSSTGIKENIILLESFSQVKEYFYKEEFGWIFSQFKWTWLYFYTKDQVFEDNLPSKIIEIMKLKLKYEHSVLRRIAEFDDLPSRFLIVGILDYNEKTATIFDGFYSFTVEIDRNIYNLLKKNNCCLGSKIFIFGSQILLKEPKSIFEINEPVLKLFYNSVKVCSNDFKMGFGHKVSFLNTISCINPNGGTISCLIVKVKKVIERKYLVTVESYRNRVDDLEKEINKIIEIARKVGHTIEPGSIKSCEFVKMLVEDETGECLLTWWSPPEIKAQESYKLIYLAPVESSLGIHVTTSKRTYWEKL